MLTLKRELQKLTANPSVLSTVTDNKVTPLQSKMDDKSALLTKFFHTTLTKRIQVSRQESTVHFVRLYMPFSKNIP